MGNDWRQVRVADIAAPLPNALATGPFGSAIGSRFFQASGVPVLRGGNLSEAVGERLIEDGLVFVSAEKAEEFSRSVVRAGDLVFTCWGTIGQVGLIDHRARYPKYIISNKQMKLTPDPAVADSLFLYYCFSSSPVSDDIKGQAIGSSVPGFNLGQLREIRLLLPSLSTQRAIARILGALDDKIELNRQMNRTLEGMARTLFQSWFVDFDPVRVKAAGLEPVGMDAETASLFPSEFEESATGRLPRGWKLAPALSLFSLISGGTPRTDMQEYWGGPIKWASAKDVSQGSNEFFLLETDRKITQRGLDSSAAKIIPADAVVVVARGATCGRHVTLGEAMAMNQTCYALVPLRSEDRWFVCFSATELIRCLVKQAHGSVFDTITTATFERGTIVLPPQALRAAFTSRVSGLVESIRSLQQESGTLAALRDTLLPKFLRGELRVPEAEAAVGKAL